MKCISLWQPWATLVAIGAKRIETRSWPTAYRGELAIHAALKWNDELNAICDQPEFYRALRAGGISRFLSGRWDLPRGVVVATCKLVDCAYIDLRDMDSPEKVYPIPDMPERAFGDYTPGRCAWILDDIKPLDPPVPAKGAQGFWEWRVSPGARVTSRIGNTGGLF